MSIEQVSLALNTPGLDPTTKLVLIGLANHSHRDGSNAFPTKATLAEYSGVDPRSVQRHLRTLRDRGLIEETRRAYRGHATVYQLRLTGDRLSPQEDATATLPGDAHEPLGRHPAIVGETPMTVWGDTGVYPNRHEPSTTVSEPSAPRTLNMFGAICQAMGYDLSTFSESDRREVGEVAKNLTEKGLTVEDVAEYVAWLTGPHSTIVNGTRLTLHSLPKWVKDWRAKPRVVTKPTGKQSGIANLIADLEAQGL